MLEADTECASNDYMQHMFGIDAVQSLRSGMRAYRVTSGVKHIGVTVVSRLPIDTHWSALVSLGYKRLLGDAPDSPIVDDRGDENGYIASFGLVFRF